LLAHLYEFFIERGCDGFELSGCRFDVRERVAQTFELVFGMVERAPAHGALRLRGLRNVAHPPRKLESVSLLFQRAGVAVHCGPQLRHVLQAPLQLRELKGDNALLVLEFGRLRRRRIEMPYR